MRIFVNCYKNNKFRVNIFDEISGKKTGFDTPSYFSLGLLLHMIKNHFGVNEITLNCKHITPRLQKILGELGIKWEQNRRA